MAKRSVLLVSVTALTLVTMAAIAPAHTKRFKTSLASLSATEGSTPQRVAVSGVVVSGRKGCVRNREVRAGSFNPATGLTSDVHSVTTRANGAFSIETSRRGNLYKVEASRKRLPSRRGHRHICKRKTVVVERS